LERTVRRVMMDGSTPYVHFFSVEYTFLHLTLPYEHQFQRIFPLPRALTNGTAAYLDIVPTKEGWKHIALFSPASSSTPVFLTNGTWEVTAGILGVSPHEGGVAYFQASQPSPGERHLFSVSLKRRGQMQDVKEDEKKIGDEEFVVKELTDASAVAYYEASFSPQAGFYLLSYEGPGVPYQRVLGTGGGEFAGERL
jgi:dipeptidyl aminopeptidase B